MPDAHTLASEDDDVDNVEGGRIAAFFFFWSGLLPEKLIPFRSGRLVSQIRTFWLFE